MYLPVEGVESVLSIDSFAFLSVHACFTVKIIFNNDKKKLTVSIFPYQYLYIADILLLIIQVNEL